MSFITPIGGSDGSEFLIGQDQTAALAKIDWDEGKVGFFTPRGFFGKILVVTNVERFRFRGKTKNDPTFFANSSPQNFTGVGGKASLRNRR